MLWSGKQCETDRHEVCSHLGGWRSNATTTFHLCAESCVLQTECNSCSLLHARLVNCGGSCVPSTSAHPCGSRPCLNGGSCNASTDSFGCFAGFNCSCPAGWGGSVCEYDLDECLSEPCRNGATCVDGLDAFACECAPGFSGLTCALDHWITGHADRECGPIVFFGKIS